MDMKQLKSNITVLIERHKYVLIILIIGIALMLLPFGKSSSDNRQNVDLEVCSSVIPVHQELEQILASVKGVGNVKVMLNEAAGSETVYQINEDYSQSDNGSNSSMECVTLTDSDRNEYGLIKQIIPPVYQGAIVICQGADDPAVKLAITNAVSKITGLGADKIAVLKMK